MFRLNRIGEMTGFSGVAVVPRRGLPDHYAKVPGIFGRLKMLFITGRQKVSIKHKAWLLAIITTLPGAAFGATLTVPAGSGDIFWANAAGSVSATWQNTATSDISTYAFRWNVATEVNGANLCNKSDGRGYIAQSGAIGAGVTITPGAIMHFTAGSLKNVISSTNKGESTGTANLIANGTMTNLVNGRAAGNQVLCTANVAGTATNQGASINTSLTGGKVSIYVDKTAVPGTYAIPALYLAVDKAGAATKQITDAGTLVILPPVSCTVNTPAVVAFGDINPQMVGKTGVSVANTLGVACTLAPGNSANVSWSVKPKSQAGDKYTLPMISSAGGIAGDIRGFLGTTAAADAGCADKTTSVRMDNTPAPLRTFSQTGTQSYPLIWSLCPRANAKPGPATATATIDVTW